MNFDDTQELREWRLQVRDFLKTERPNEYDPGAMSEGMFVSRNGGTPGNQHCQKKDGLHRLGLRNTGVQALG